MLRSSGAALLRTLRQGGVAGSPGIEQSSSKLIQVHFCRRLYVLTF